MSDVVEGAEKVVDKVGVSVSDAADVVHKKLGAAKKELDDLKIFVKEMEDKGLALADKVDQDLVTELQNLHASIQASLKK